MIAVITYFGICFAVSLVITFLYVITRPIKNRDEMRSWRVGIAITIVILMLPYLAVEVQTRMYGGKMKEAVEDALYEAGIEGPLLYYKVLVYQGNKARVLALGEEKQSWGGMDHPTMQMTLVKSDNTWKAESYNIIYSENRNLDGVVLPPYW
jgi:hypothetical protein